MVGSPAGYVAVATPGATVTFRFTVPMDRAAVERFVALEVPEPRMTWLNDLELRVEVPLKAGQIVKLDSVGMPDRWGRKIGNTAPLVLKAFPQVSMRRFAYDPETGEAHPFTGEQIPGIFTEGAPNPNDGWPMLLWGEGCPFLVGGQIRLLVCGQLPPLFYGWMPDGERIIYTDDRIVMVLDLSGKLAASYKGPLTGGAISPRSGHVALFQPSADGQVHLVAWNPDTGAETDYGPVAAGVTGRVEASWSPDESQIVFTANGELRRFEFATRKVAAIANGYHRPVFSPARPDLIYAENEADAVILSPEGKVLHNLPGQGWFWHPSGLALDRSAPPQNGQPPYDLWITNYRLSDRRLQLRGKGVVIGEGPGPGAGAMYHLLLTETP
jgi:hypothetical protein